LFDVQATYSSDLVNALVLPKEKMELLMAIGRRIVKRESPKRRKSRNCSTRMRRSGGGQLFVLYGPPSVGKKRRKKSIKRLKNKVKELACEYHGEVLHYHLRL